MRQTLRFVVVLLVLMAARYQPPHGVPEAAADVERLVGRSSGDGTAGARGQGEFTDERGALPVPQGAVTLSRAR
jgi:hypothetical protein